jgi:hypothetical protein
VKVARDRLLVVGQLTGTVGCKAYIVKAVGRLVHQHRAQVRVPLYGCRIRGLRFSDEGPRARPVTLTGGRLHGYSGTVVHQNRLTRNLLIKFDPGQMILGQTFFTVSPSNIAEKRRPPT